MRLIVRNRTHPISSRNLHTLELWEPFKVIRTVIGEDGEEWYWVQYQGFSKKNYGYIKKGDELIKITDDFELSSLPNRDSKKIFFLFLADFYQKNYFKSIEKITGLIDESSFFPERLAVWMNLNLKEIADRSTAHNTQYSRFVKTYPHFFSVVDRISLRPSQFLVDGLLRLNSQSKMLQYLSP